MFEEPGASTARVSIPGGRKVKQQQPVYATSGTFSTPTRIFLLEISGLLLLTAVIFWDVLFMPGDVVLSSSRTDLAHEFLQARYFGFKELASGNLALWNPHIFCGAPFFAGFQAALLYPFNWLFMILSIEKAINFSIAFHVLMGGIFFYLWAQGRGLHHLACFLAAVEFMFCAPHFLHIYAGHLSYLCTLIWIPLLFLAIDRIHEKSSGVWMLLGIFAILMQILAGHIQLVFYTGVAASLYAVLLLTRSKRKLRFCLMFLGVYVGALLLSSVQFLPGVQAAAECVRGPGTPLEFASMFSFPPENLITWLTPGLLGDMTAYPYWGRCYLWEMSLFFSVTGFALAIYALVFIKGRTKIELSIMAILLLLLAFGYHMPWFSTLYAYVPGFNKFRANSKFICLATVFMIMLSATGMNHIFANGFKKPRRFALTALLITLAAISAAACIQSLTAVQEIWKQIMQTIAKTGESYLPDVFYYHPKNIIAAGKFAARSLYVFAGTCLLIALTAEVVRKKPKLTFLFVVLATAELLFFAHSSMDTFHPSKIVPESVSTFLAKNEEDYRVLLSSSNATMLYGGMGIWGYDPFVLRRYAELVAFTQGVDPDKATQNITLRRYHPLFDLMRCKYLVFVNRDKSDIWQCSQNYMHRASIIHSWTVISSRDGAFLEMSSPGFNPRELVVLENDPGIGVQDVKSTESDVNILDSSTDHVTIEAQTNSPAILLITDSYSKGWHARALEGSSQGRYDVVPADYAFQGVPLKPGKHRIRLEYMPWEFRFGEAISLLSLGILIAVVSIRAFGRISGKH